MFTNMFFVHLVQARGSLSKQIPVRLDNLSTIYDDSQYYVYSAVYVHNPNYQIACQVGVR